MEALFLIHGLVAFGIVVMMVARTKPPRRQVDDGPVADPALRVALEERQPGINNQGML